MKTTIYYWSNKCFNSQFKTEQSVPINRPVALKLILVQIHTEMAHA